MSPIPTIMAGINGSSSSKKLDIPPGVNSRATLPTALPMFVQAWGVPRGMNTHAPSGASATSSPTLNLNGAGEDVIRLVVAVVNVLGHSDRGIHRQLTEIHRRAERLPGEEFAGPELVLLSLAGRNDSLIRSHVEFLSVGSSGLWSVPHES